mgnify:CR=1 FL=1
MKVYTYSEARQNLATILDESMTEDVLIRRRSGETFRVTPQKSNKSPFDVKGLNTDITVDEIVKAVRESRGPRR